MRTFSAKDQSKMSLLFAPFGYIVSTFCPDQFIEPAHGGHFYYQRWTEALFRRSNFSRILYDNHFFTFLSVIYWLIPKVNIDNLNICSFLICLSCNCLLYKIFPGIAKLCPPSRKSWPKCPWPNCPGQTIRGQTILHSLRLCRATLCSAGEAFNVAILLHLTLACLKKIRSTCNNGKCGIGNYLGLRLGLVINFTRWSNYIAHGHCVDAD